MAGKLCSMTRQFETGVLPIDYRDLNTIHPLTSKERIESPNMVYKN